MPPQTSAVAIQTGYFDDTKVYFSENNKKKNQIYFVAFVLQLSRL